MPLSEYTLHRRVTFHEVDSAGIVHFSVYFRYMEEAEHALWRAAGLSIVPMDSPIAFPRVAVSINFKAPLFFENEFDVLVRITAISARSIAYSHTVTRGDTTIATGTMTAVCVSKKSDGTMQATAIPAAILERLAVHA